MLWLVWNNECHLYDLTGILQATLDWADSHLGFIWTKWYLFRDINQQCHVLSLTFPTKQQTQMAIPELRRELGRVSNFNQSIDGHHHMKDLIQIGHLTKFDAFRMNFETHPSSLCNSGMANVQQHIQNGDSLFLSLPSSRPTFWQSNLSRAGRAVSVWGWLNYVIKINYNNLKVRFVVGLTEAFLGVY